MANRADNFNRADNSSSLGTPSDGGGAWTANRGTWGIATNRAYETTGDVQNMATLEASSADVEVQVTGAVVSSHFGVCARLTDASNHILVDFSSSSNELKLQKFEAGSFTGLGTNYSATPTAGDVIKLVCNGNQLSVYLNGTLRIGPVTESFNSTATKHGLWVYGDLTCRLDDFSITDLGGGGPAFVARPPLVVRQAVNRASTY